MDKIQQNFVAKSELTSKVVASVDNLLSDRDVSSAVNYILEHITDGIVSGKRLEIRNFASIQLRFRKEKIGRNPKTGEDVFVAEKFTPHFKPSLDLRARLNLIEDHR